jgi:hypothetical protein
MSDGCGPPPWTRFAVFGPDGSCGRTRVLCLDLGTESPSDGFSARWPRWATWDRTGAYALAMSEPATDESGCSSLLPTPVAQDDQKQPAEHLRKKVASGAGEVITSLTVMSRQYAVTGQWSNKLLPTPTTEPMTGNGHARNLGGEMKALLPTPTARDHKGRNQRDDETCLPGAVRSIGATTPPPSPDTPPCSDDPPRLPLTTGDD